MCVGGVDSVVVEGWSSGFVVGLVLVVGQGGYFGELVLAPVGPPTSDQTHCYCRIGDIMDSGSLET